MKVCKTIPIFILLFTGYLCNTEDGFSTREITSFAPYPAKGLSPPLENTTQASTDHAELGTTPSNNSGPERRLSSVVVAGVSISFVFLFIVIITGFWYAQKKSKASSAEINSVLSTERGVSLRNIAMKENQP